MTEIDICLTCQAPPCAGNIAPGCPLWQYRQAHRSAHSPGHFDGCGCTKCDTGRKLKEARRRWDGTPMTLAEFARFSRVNVSTIRNKVYAGILGGAKLPPQTEWGRIGKPILHVIGV